jgi:DNA-binding response OmpR family regulator
MGELSARIRAVLRRAPDHQGGSADKLQAGLIRLDLTGRRVYRQDEEVKLSSKEFDLLAELMRNPGVVLSRDLILSRVWGYDYIGESRTVDVHIRWLRQKVESDAANPRHIVTVRGIGYRFEV